MKHCLECQTNFESEDWVCPSCHYQPQLRDNIYRFATDPSETSVGFDPEGFARLAALEAGHFWFRTRNRLIQWALPKYFPKARNFLEVGCGTGFVLAGLQEARPALCLCGSELFSDGLRFARARLPWVDLYQMDARRIPFTDEFDVVGAFDVLEHVVKDEEVLAQIFRATRPDGGLLVTVPQHPALWSATDAHARHQRRYSRLELSRKVRAAGFRIERMTSFVSLLLPLMVISRMTSNTRGRVNPWAEFEVSRPLNTLLEVFLMLEGAMIRSGISFPAGGSLLLVARKPPNRL